MQSSSNATGLKPYLRIDRVFEIRKKFGNPDFFVKLKIFGFKYFGP